MIKKNISREVEGFSGRGGRKEMVYGGGDGWG